MAMNTVNGQDQNGVLAPGVYYQEVVLPKGPQLQTGVPLFVGFGEVTGTEKREKFGPGRTEVFRPTDREHFDRFFKPGTFGGYLDYAVRGFFENGGENCVVASLPEIKGGYARKRALEKSFADKGPLEDIEDVDLVCVPDIMSEEILSLHNAAVDLQRHVLDYCRRMEDRFAVLDCAFVNGSNEKVIKRTTTDHQQELVEHVLHWHSKIPQKGRAVEGAVYFPWIRVKPLARHKNEAYVSIPPCGHIAGIYARSDSIFGVHKAPANEIVEGALDLEFVISGELQGELNNLGVNCLRSFPGRGIRVWGARTLSSQMNWKYINVRRLFLTLVRWIMHNLDDMLFEPNEPTLWENVSDRVGTYCYELFQLGALKGLSPGEAYFVKCDAETNPMALREAGQLICEVGLAPVVPAEFVVVRIVKNVSGTTATLPTII